MKIGEVKLDNNIILAPMAGITDHPFRLLCKEQGCGLVYSEMISARGFLNGPEKYLKGLFFFSEEERPVSVQFFGSDPEIMGLASGKARDVGADIIDINMGCPVRKILKNGEGARLMREPLKAARIMEKVAGSVDIPVTVKMRKGWESENYGALELARMARESGIAAVTIHGRTVEQGFGGKADWDIIKKVKENVDITVIGNGDIFSPGDAEKMLKTTGCDGIMIGRGIKGNPWLISRIRGRLLEGKNVPEPTLEEKIKMALRHLELLVEFKGERIAVREMRKHAGWYLKELDGAALAREEINKAVNKEEMVKVLCLFLERQRNNR